MKNNEEYLKGLKIEKEDRYISKANTYVRKVQSIKSKYNR